MTWWQPRGLAEAVELKAAHPDATVVAAFNAIYAGEENATQGGKLVPTLPSLPPGFDATVASTPSRFGATTEKCSATRPSSNALVNATACTLVADGVHDTGLEARSA